MIMRVTWSLTLTPSLSLQGRGKQGPSRLVHRTLWRTYSKTNFLLFEQVP
jgi:hypothetical protein